MAQRLTPIIGLAVAAALALAAVFGLVGLTPAYAGVESPDSRGLDGKVFHAAVDSTDNEITAVDATVRVPLNSTVTFAMDSVFTDTTDGSGTAITSYRAFPSDTDRMPSDAALAEAGVSASGASDDADVVAAALAAAKYRLGPHTADVRKTDNDPATFASSGDGYTGAYTEFGYNVAADKAYPMEITGLVVGSYTLTIRAIDDESGNTQKAESVVTIEVYENIVPSSYKPGANARFDVNFVAPTALEASASEISIDLVDFKLPSTIDRSQVSIKSDAVYGNDADGNEDQLLPQGTAVTGGNYQVGYQTPTAVSVSGDELTLTVPDMNPVSDASADNIRAGDLVTILIQQGAGINNPTEGGNYDEIEITNNVDSTTIAGSVIAVPFLVELSEEDGGRGTTVTATGKGFKNGTSLGFFLDLPSHVDDDNDPATAASDDDGTDGVDTNMEPNGTFDPGEVKLCDVASVGGNDVGSCDFTVNNPPFTPGPNFINAVDGRSNYGTYQMDDDQKFSLDPSITVTPNGGDPGETILVQGYDFPAGTVTRVRLARQDRNAAGEASSAGLANDITGSNSVGTNGDLNFRLVIPNWAVEGVQDLQVTAGGSSDNVNVTIGGPQITVTPTTVLPNQRISLVGTGFTPNSRVAGGNGGLDPSITIGGYVIEISKINEGDPVNVDNGGKWSASLDVPLRDVTTRDGSREIRVTDSGGRSGTVNVTIPARVVTIDPASGRIGTEATIRGENFPSKNDNGESFNISIEYDAGGRPSTVSTVSDASGRFEATIRVPTSATIPSTNTVRVSFDDEEDVPVTTTVTHDVPEGNITLSASSGAPGSRVTLRGEGFKTFVPVKSVSIGGIDVLPSPAPATNGQGMTEFEILVPGLDSGIQTIEVEVSDTTASIGFTVTTAAEIGAETPVAEGVANLGDNFLRAFNFNNDTKSWTFYDPDAGDASTMDYFIAGSSYWILVGQTQEVILNRETRNLTCVSGNCWNLVVW